MIKEKFLRFKSPELLMTFFTRSDDSFLQSLHTSIALFLGGKVCKVEKVSEISTCGRFIHTTVDGFPVVVPICFLEELEEDEKNKLETKDLEIELCNLIKDQVKNKLQDKITMNTDWVLDTTLYSDYIDKKFFAFKGIFLDDIKDSVDTFTELKAEEIFKCIRDYVQDNNLVPSHGILVYNIGKLEYLIDKDCFNPLYRGLIYFKQVIDMPT